MDKLRELREQLDRCKRWLEQEPDDTEVIDKVRELEDSIREIEDERNKTKLCEKIFSLSKEIKSLKRKIGETMPIIKGFEKECYALREVENSLKQYETKTLNEKIAEYNKLVVEYVDKYGKEVK